MSDRKDIRELLAIRCKATAVLQYQMAAALVGKGQDELRKHFSDSAELLIAVADELRSEACK